MTKFEKQTYNEANGRAHKLPIASTVATGLVALATWQSESKIVRTLSEIRPNSSWKDWLVRWPGSFFVASPYAGKAIDGLAAVATTALAFGLSERKDGIARTFKLVVIAQAAGSIATRLASVGGMVANKDMDRLDSGPSVVTVALGANYLTEKMRESETSRGKITWGLGVAAFGTAVTVGTYITEPNMTDVIGHGIGFVAGFITGSMTEP